MLKIIIIILALILITIFISYKPAKSHKKKHTPKIIYKQYSSTPPPLAYPESINSIMISQGMGCGELRKPFDMESFNRGEPQTSCATGIDGKLAGDFHQICATQDLKVVDCNKPNSNPYNPFEDVYYMTDIMDCNCGTYMSEAQGKNVNYKGQYCQYDDSNICNKRGVVDYNGNCDCSQSIVKYCSQSQKKLVNYIGKKCDIDDNKYCKGLGIVYDQPDLGCDFSVLKDVKKYKYADVNNINDGDILIIEFGNSDLFVGGGPDLYILRAIPNPDVFIVKKVNYNNEIRYTFNLVDLKTNSPSALSSFYFLNTDLQGNTSYKTNATVYAVTGSTMLSDAYNLTVEDSPLHFFPVLLCDPTTYNLGRANSNSAFEFNWRFHKFNFPLDDNSCI